MNSSPLHTPLVDFVVHRLPRSGINQLFTRPSKVAGIKHKTPPLQRRKRGFEFVIPWHPLRFDVVIFNPALTLGQFWGNVNQGIPDFLVRKTWFFVSRRGAKNAERSCFWLIGEEKGWEGDSEGRQGWVQSFWEKESIIFSRRGAENAEGLVCD